MATTVQQLLLLLLDAVSAPTSPGASQTALLASGGIGSVGSGFRAVTSTTVGDESMSIVPPSPGTAMQVGWDHSQNLNLGVVAVVATTASFLYGHD